MRTRRGAERSGGRSSCALCAGTEGYQRGGGGRRSAADAPSLELTLVRAHVTGAQPDGQLKTLSGQQGLIAEHAHGDAARLRSSYG
ncbi:hypothetical protein NDU88_004981 [Pleurodeles waltl]|uniref:Uncharacterized protein n=1 Tax=Pleurodeles waltl TaxID=8319 RepID=A0AAV7TVY4_PLEWA|nr:hypothetical protein NDU88_004981 [Pleurodeles waltl]